MLRRPMLRRPNASSIRPNYTRSMPLSALPSDAPRVRSTLGLYRISAFVTGGFLLILCLIMVFRYGFHVDIELGGAQGFLALVPKDLIQAVNLSVVILIIHGWLYVVYLFLDFRLWSLLRWPFGRFVLVALGGIVPFLSFYLERRVHRQVSEQLAVLEAAQPAEASH
jgi:integral membrane protein